MGNTPQWEIDDDKIELIGKSNCHYYRCDGCKKAPIFGSRFHCEDCKDFDFCEDCYNTIDHHHKFKEIKSNEDFCEDKMK